MESWKMLGIKFILQYMLVFGGVLCFKSRQSWFKCYKSNNSELYRTSFRTCENYEKITIENCTDVDILQTILSQIYDEKMSNHRTVQMQIENTSLIELLAINRLDHLDLSHTNLERTDLTKFENLKYLNLTGNFFSTMKNIILNKNTELEELDLSRNRFLKFSTDSIPSTRNLKFFNNNIFELELNMTLPKNLLKLDFTRNEIVNLSKIIFNSENLKILNLSVNLIENTSRFTFEYLPNLEELILSCNKISFIDEETFTNNKKLIKLSLRDNNLSELGEKIFHRLINLQFLDLSKNSLVKILPSTFQFLDNLSDLILSENKRFSMVSEFGTQIQFLLAAQRLQNVKMDKLNLTIFPTTLTKSVRLLDLSANDYTSIQSGDLDSYPLLQILKLQSNKIENVEYDVLSRLEYLEILLMDKNKLNKIPRTLPSVLKELQLSENHIRSVLEDDFYQLSKLKILVLNSNKIEFIAEGAFEPLTKLKTLDISNNPIKSLNMFTFKGPSKLEILSMSEIRTLPYDSDDLTSFPLIEMSHIRILNLSNSPVLGLLFIEDHKIFEKMKKTKIIDLTNTEIMSIPYALKYFMPKLKKLKLGQNTINCNNITWLIDWLKEMSHIESKKLNEKIKIPPNSDHNFQLIILRKFQQENIIQNSVSIVNEEPVCILPKSLSGQSIFNISNIEENVHNFKYENFKNYNDYNIISDNIIIDCGKVPSEETQPLRINDNKIGAFDRIWYNIFGIFPDEHFLKPTINLTENLEQSFKSNEPEIFILTNLPSNSTHLSDIEGLNKTSYKINSENLEKKNVKNISENFKSKSSANGIEEKQFIGKFVTENNRAVNKFNLINKSFEKKKGFQLKANELAEKLPFFSKNTTVENKFIDTGKIDILTSNKSDKIFNGIINRNRDNVTFSENSTINLANNKSNFSKNNDLLLNFPEENQDIADVSYKEIKFRVKRKQAINNSSRNTLTLFKNNSSTTEILIDDKTKIKNTIIKIQPVVNPNFNIVENSNSSNKTNFEQFHANSTQTILQSDLCKNLKETDTKNQIRPKNENFSNFNGTWNNNIPNFEYHYLNTSNTNSVLNFKEYENLNQELKILKNKTIAPEKKNFGISNNTQNLFDGRSETDLNFNFNAENIFESNFQPQKIRRDLENQNLKKSKFATSSKDAIKIGIDEFSPKNSINESNRNNVSINSINEVTLKNSSNLSESVLIYSEESGDSFVDLIIPNGTVSTTISENNLTITESNSTTEGMTYYSHTGTIIIVIVFILMIIQTMPCSLTRFTKNMYRKLTCKYQQPLQDDAERQSIEIPNVSTVTTDFEEIW